MAHVNPSDSDFAVLSEDVTGLKEELMQTLGQLRKSQSEVSAEARGRIQVYRQLREDLRSQHEIIDTITSSVDDLVVDMRSEIQDLRASCAELDRGIREVHDFMQSRNVTEKAEMVSISNGLDQEVNACEDAIVEEKSLRETTFEDLRQEVVSDIHNHIDRASASREQATRFIREVDVVLKREVEERVKGDRIVEGCAHELSASVADVAELLRQTGETLDGAMKERLRLQGPCREELQHQQEALLRLQKFVEDPTSLSPSKKSERYGGSALEPFTQLGQGGNQYSPRFSTTNFSFAGALGVSVSGTPIRTTSALQPVTQRSVSPAHNTWRQMSSSPGPVGGEVLTPRGLVSPRGNLPPKIPTPR